MKIIMVHKIHFSQLGRFTTHKNKRIFVVFIDLKRESPESTTSEESLEEGGDTTALTMKMHFNTNK